MRRMISKRRLLRDTDKYIINELHQQSCALEKHERQIAQHTALQTYIAGWQMFIGVITTLVLIYITYQQYNAAERQVTLEYAKVAPQFIITMDFQNTELDNPRDNKFPRNLKIRLERGDATITSVEILQDISVSALLYSNKKSEHLRCVMRVSNYFKQSPGSSTDFINSNAARRIPLDPSWLDSKTDLTKFDIIEASGTLVKIDFIDILGNRRTVKFSGSKSLLQQIPSGDFARSSTYETVATEILDKPIKLAGSFKLTGSMPNTKGCRYQFNLTGGKPRFF